MSRSVCKVPLMFVNICTPFQSRLNQSCQQNNVTLTKTWPNIYLFWTEFTLGHGGSYPIQIKVANSPFLDSKFSLPSFLTLSEIWLTTIWHDMSLLWNCFHDKLKYLNKNFFSKGQLLSNWINIVVCMFFDESRDISLFPCPEASINQRYVMCICNTRHTEASESFQDEGR